MISRPQSFDKARALFWPLLLLLSNLMVALGTELAYDEAYYWMFSRRLDWSYFDHPPMAALWIAFTAWLPSELGVRLFFVITTQASVWLMSRMVPRERAWLVWGSFSVFPLLAFSGFLALPDGPLVVFSVVWLWALKRSLDKDSWKNAALMGVMSALLLYSKYHGVLFIAGTIIAVPSLLRRPTFWVAAVVGLILFLPHMHWQWAHDFVTFRYHFVDRPQVPFGFRSPFEFLGSQLLLQGALLGPLLWYYVFRSKATTDFDRALKVLTCFIPLFFLLSSFNKKVEANWAIAVGISMVLYLARQESINWRGRWLRALGLISVLVILFGKFALVFPPKLAILERAQEFHGWRQWAAHVRQLAGPDCSLVANRYQIASKLSFYLQTDVPALNVSTRLNQFELWDLEKNFADGPVCWVTNTRQFPGEKVPTPDGKNLILVKGIPLSDILSHKEKSL